MNLTSYIKKVDVRKLLMYLNIIDIKELIIPINIEPDYDVSEYKREIDTDYFFINEWSYKGYFETLTSFEFLTHRLYHQNYFQELDNDLKSELTSVSIEEDLNIINRLNKDSFAWSGYDSGELDEFKLKYIRLRSINNINKCIKYEGTFFGGSYGLNVLDWGECGFFAKIQMEGISRSILYNDLLGESYLLYLSGNYKLSHFVAYSAFENFLNLKTNSFEVQERLSEKLKKLFRESSIDTNKNVVYCSVVNNFSKQTKRRNDVAHGMDAVDINERAVREFLIEIITMIILYNNNYLNFKEVIEQVELEYRRKTQPNIV
ncbi:hypothetical protein I2I11_04905 [Pontibacter sp. 172403-2]|uniref:hypothetical protein n=1 Tax=Pontibacter rufus TaxID=2791028 RepID=UPI0018AFBB74|nr:hypothetical protein [Pontibacter sp. 172403-2]MBF9252622.1 hypothetical protein [Pontibacter sp. 172403-2]